MNSAQESNDLREHEERLKFLRARRAEIAAERSRDATASTLRPSRSFVYTDGGRRDFVYPALPNALDTQAQLDLCSAWIEKELTSRGMICEATLYEDGPIFSCPTRKLGPQGFGKVVDEWCTLEFFARLQQSFTQAVNDELEKRGLPRDFTF